MLARENSALDRFALPKELFQLALPMMMSFVAYTLMGMTDTALMGRVGTVEVGAVGLGNLLILAFQLLFKGTLESVTFFAARSLGEGDRKGVSRWFGVFYALAWVLGIPVLLLSLGLLPLVLHLMASDAAVSEAVKIYVNIRLFEIPFAFVMAVTSSFMIALGNSKTPMILAWTAVISNMVLAVTAVYVLHWGIVGAAWATLAAVIVQTLLSLFFLYRMYSKTYDLRPKRPSLRELSSVTKMALPVGGAQLLEVTAFATFQAIISRLGALPLAASQIANQWAAIGFMPAFALGGATGSLLSRYLGAGKPEIAAKVGWWGALLGIAIMLVLSAFFWLIPIPMISLFTDKVEIFPLAVTVMHLMTFYQLFDALGIILGAALQSAGDGRFRFWIVLLGTWGVMVPLSQYLSQTHWGLEGAWFGALVYLSVAALLYAWRFYGGKWKSKIHL